MVVKPNIECSKYLKHFASKLNLFQKLDIQHKQRFVLTFYGTINIVEGNTA